MGECNFDKEFFLGSVGVLVGVMCVSGLRVRGGSFVQLSARCQEEEQSGSGEEPTSGRSSGQTEKDDNKDTDRDRRAVTHP